MSVFHRLHELLVCKRGLDWQRAISGLGDLVGSLCAIALLVVALLVLHVILRQILLGSLWWSSHRSSCLAGLPHLGFLLHGLRLLVASVHHAVVDCRMVPGRVGLRSHGGRGCVVLRLHVIVDWLVCHARDSKLRVIEVPDWSLLLVLVVQPQNHLEVVLVDLLQGLSGVHGQLVAAKDSRNELVHDHVVLLLHRQRRQVLRTGPVFLKLWLFYYYILVVHVLF